MSTQLQGSRVLSTFVHALDWTATRRLLTQWIAARESRYVCLCNVHSVVTADDDPEFAAVLAEADLALPDGMPVAWLLRHKGFRGQPRIGGPDLMWACCEDLEKSGDPVFLFGSGQETLDRLVANLRQVFPGLVIAGAMSPPYRPLTEAEEASIARDINDSGARAVFVALGCPRQEIWMRRNRPRIRAVMFGFGAAFDFHAGTVKRAPRWMQRTGLEWAYRLASEPRRLASRYLVTNSKFIYALARSAVRK